MDTLAPPPAEDAGSKPEVTVGSGAASVVAVVSAESCVSETSPRVFEQELTPIGERPTTATSSFEMLRPWHKLRAQNVHASAVRGHPLIALGSQPIPATRAVRVCEVRYLGPSPPLGEVISSYLQTPARCLTSAGVTTPFLRRPRAGRRHCQTRRLGCIEFVLCARRVLFHQLFSL